VNEKVKSELDRIVNTLVETGIVTKIILFGSYAEGRETPNSDIDLCVLTSVKDRRALDISIELQIKIINVQESPLDLLAYNEDEFYSYAESPKSFHRHIKEKGVVLYGN
jgi:predicted nucleotidyltransferase